METGLLHLHSLLRWVVLIIMVLAIVKAYQGKKNALPFDRIKKLALFSMITLHLQLVIGLALYFMRSWHKVWSQGGFMGDTATRFFTMEHLMMMVIAIGLATAGYSTAKRMEGDVKKNNRIFVFYLIALIIILASIPWPFRTALGAHSWI
jgi:L-asparagine transporter-like permease